MDYREWCQRSLENLEVVYLWVDTKGSMRPENPLAVSSVLEAELRTHSEKPEEVYGIIETLYPGHKYLELFARHEQGGAWTSWGAALSARSYL